MAALGKALGFAWTAEMGRFADLLLSTPFRSLFAIIGALESGHSASKLRLRPEGVAIPADLSLVDHKSAVPAGAAFSPMAASSSQTPCSSRTILRAERPQGATTTAAVWLFCQSRACYHKLSKLALGDLAPNTAVLLILVALRASIGSASNPARQAVIPMLVRSDQLTAVNSALFTIRQITRVLGPAFGWALLLVMSAQWVFAVTSLLAIVAALAFGLLEIPERKSRPHPSSSTALLGSLKEGVDEVTRKPLLFAATFYFVAGMFATFLYDGFAVLFLNDVGQPASFLGAVMAALGAGGIVGAFAVGRLKLTSQSAFACMAAAGLVTGILIAGAGMLAYVAQSTSGPGLLALFFAVGAASSFALIPYRTVVQLETSKDKIGRVTALSDALVAAAMFSAPFLGGLLISAFRVGSSFLVSGALTIGIAGLTWLLVTRTNASGLIEPNRTGPQ